MVTLSCSLCSKEYQVYKCWADRPGPKFCSKACCAKGRRKRIKILENYTCIQCGKERTVRRGFAGKNLYCGRQCASIGHRTDNFERSRSGHNKWAKAVINRDLGCVRCGAIDKELHAHHIKSYKEFPELRLDLANGETLCVDCHIAEHPNIAYLLRNKRKPKFRKSCEMCTKVFISSTRSARYCDRTCAGLGRSITAGSIHSCFRCGVVFRAKPSRRNSTKVFCSKACSSIWFGSTQGGRRWPIGSQEQLSIRAL